MAYVLVVGNVKSIYGVAFRKRNRYCRASKADKDNDVEIHHFKGCVDLVDVKSDKTEILLG